jgi:hypothetical protein
LAAGGRTRSPLVVVFGLLRGLAAARRPRTGGIGCCLRATARLVGVFRVFVLVFALVVSVLVVGLVGLDVLVVVFLVVLVLAVGVVTLDILVIFVVALVGLGGLGVLFLLVLSGPATARLLGLLVVLVARRTGCRPAATLARVRRLGLLLRLGAAALSRGAGLPIRGGRVLPLAVRHVAPFHDEEPALVGGPIDERDLLHHDVAQAVNALLIAVGCFACWVRFVRHGSGT